MSRALLDWAGKRFGRLLVVRRCEKGLRKRTAWWCRCSCGNPKEIIVFHFNLSRGSTRSCGCLQVERVRAANLIHGHAGRGQESRAFKAWKAMKARCLYKSGNRYHRYGGRGIRVCERWLVFENFLLDLGEPPPGHTLERIDNDGNYEPSNVKWATRKEQMANTSRTKLVVVNGEKMTAASAALSLGVRPGVLYSAVRRRRISHQQAYEYLASRYKGG